MLVELSLQDSRVEKLWNGEMVCIKWHLSCDDFLLLIIIKELLQLKFDAE
jgi:hypothetical protein